MTTRIELVYNFLETAKNGATLRQIAEGTKLEVQVVLAALKVLERLEKVDPITQTRWFTLGNFIEAL